MATTTEKLRLSGALVAVIIGLFLIAFLAYKLPVGQDKWQPSDVIALVGALTTFLGTVIGSFLGVQAGAAGREKAERIASRALAALPPEAAGQIVEKEDEQAP